jgi:hypothetical protein
MRHGYCRLILTRFILKIERKKQIRRIWGKNLFPDQKRRKLNVEDKEGGVVKETSVIIKNPNTLQ